MDWYMELFRNKLAAPIWQYLIFTQIRLQSNATVKLKTYVTDDKSAVCSTLLDRRCLIYCQGPRWIPKWIVICLTKIQCRWKMFCWRNVIVINWLCDGLRFSFRYVRDLNSSCFHMDQNEAVCIAILSSEGNSFLCRGKANLGNFDQSQGF